MALQAEFQDYWVTEEKAAEAVRRIVAIANPLQVIVFGSRARGDHRPNSDLDLAVILETDQPDMAGKLYADAVRGLPMEVDLVVASKAYFDLHRPWLNSVFNYIDKEGVVVFDRSYPQSARTEIAEPFGAGRIRSDSSAA